MGQQTTMHFESNKIDPIPMILPRDCHYVLIKCVIHNMIMARPVLRRIFIHMLLSSAK